MQAIGLIFSVALHGALLAWAALEILGTSRLPEPASPTIEAELITIAEFTKLRQGDPEPEASALALIRRRPNLVLSTWSDDEIRRLLQVIVNNVAIARADVRPPGMLRCPVLLFAATGTEQEPSTAEKTESWRAVTHGPVEVIELDCKHQHMLLPEPMAIIGAALTRRLSAASRTASPSPAEP